MEDKRLTLENVQEIGLDLLKEENGNSDEISLYYNYDEEITKETMEEVREIKKSKWIWNFIWRIWRLFIRSKFWLYRWFERWTCEKNNRKQ